MPGVTTVLVFLLALAFCANSAPQSTIYDKLFDNIFSPSYKKAAMPVCIPGGKLHVGQDMVLYQLFDLDEPTQMLSIDVWVESTWKDCRLQWKKEDFNNVTEFSIKAEEIWFPDLIFYESLHGNFEEGMFIYGESTARVRYDGMVQLGAQALLKAFCRIDISEFPFDSQECSITFSSWTKDLTTFNLTRKVGDTTSKDDHAFGKASNGEWEVTGFPSFNRIVKRKVGVDESSEKDYSEVSFKLKLKRKYLFHKTYMIFPCLLLSWAALFVFILPIECGEKISYITTLLLSLVVFLLLVADNIPRSGDAVPILGKYFCISVTLVSLSTLMTIFSYNISLKGKDIKMPRFLQCLLRIGCIVGFQPEHNKDVKWMSFKKANKNGKDIPLDDKETHPCNEEEDAGITNTNRPKVAGGINQWRYLGIILDRLFFVIYFIANLISTIWIVSKG